jgi:hypothetical protein
LDTVAVNDESDLYGMEISRAIVWA